MSKQAPILLIDDDESVTVSLALLLKQAGLASVVASAPAQALDIIANQDISLVLQDMNFSRQTSGEEGLRLLADIRRLQPAMPVILMTAWGSIELAVRGMKLGASDFITKPWNNQHVLQLINTSLRLAQTSEPESTSREALDGSHDFADIVGEHPAMLRVLATVGRVAATDAPVLILGESGTGKELIADAIHRNSRRHAQPLVKVNLGGIPASLFESEMFGHVKGAFTDANANRVGRFQVAHTGTIFLDEAGDLDRSSQVKLLRVLEDRTFQPVGSSQTQHTDVRVVSATNRDLHQMIEDGEFREDLLYRLNLITIRLPPLRERRSDIRLIGEAHLEQVASNYGVAPIGVDDATWHWLETLDWPGNIRQLRQTLERAVLMSGKQQLSRIDFVDPALADDGTEPSAPGQTMTIDEMERMMIASSLKQHDHNISKVASALGLSRAALYRRLEKYGLSTSP